MKRRQFKWICDEIITGLKLEMGKSIFFILIFFYSLAMCAMNTVKGSGLHCDGAGGRGLSLFNVHSQTSY